MAYWNWINDIYTFEDAVYECFRARDEANQLRKLIGELGYTNLLYDPNGEYFIKFKDEYDGFKSSRSRKRPNATEG